MSEARYSEIGSRLRYVRTIQLGLTQEVLSEKLGISVEFYRTVESGKSLPNLNILTLLHQIYKDVDYVLLGRHAQPSVFDVVLGKMTEIRRENICNLLVYKMKELQIASRKQNDVKIHTPDYITLNHETPGIVITPYDRVREIIIFSHMSERPYGRLDKQKLSNDDIAQDINKSNRTISRLLHGKAVLKTDMVMAVCDKYDFAPSYILFGEINSNSLADRYYDVMSEKDREQVMKFAKILSEYL